MDRIEKELEKLAIYENEQHFHIENNGLEFSFTVQRTGKGFIADGLYDYHYTLLDACFYSHPNCLNILKVKINNWLRP